MSPQELKEKIEKGLGQGTLVEVVDLTGTQDHYQAKIFSPAFADKLTFEQHQIVMDLLRTDMDSGEIHALTLKTQAP